MALSGRRWVVFGLGLLWSTAAGAQPTERAQPTAQAPTLLVFLDADAGQRGRSWATALAVQLTPYGIHIREQSGRPADVDEAIRRGRGQGAIAVTWYRARRRRIRVFAIDLQQNPPRERSLVLRRGFGVERSMAAAVRTLLRARLLEVKSARRRAASQPASRPSPPTTAPARPTSRLARARGPRLRWLVQVAYEGDLSVEDPLLRHAAVLALGLRLGRWQAELWGGYGFWGEEQQAEIRWEQRGVRFGLRAGYRWPLARRLRVELSGLIRASFLEALARDGEREERGNTWQLGLGGSAALAFALHRAVELVGAIDLAALAVAPEVRVAGEKVGGSGGLLAVMRLGLRAAF